MNTESTVTGLSQHGLLQNVGMQVQKMALNQSELQGEAVQKLLASAEVLQDPALGRNIDILA